MYYSGNTPKSSTGDFNSGYYPQYSPTSLSSGLGFLDSLNPILSVLGIAGNFFSTMMTNKKNEEINQKNLDYNAAMTREQWARDDTMHQREVADLEAAGLSPLANTAGSSNGSPVAAPSPLAMQAPQFDVNSLVNAVLESQKLKENKRHNLVEEGHKDTELFLQSETIQNKALELDITNKKVEADIKHQADMITAENRQIDEVERHNKSDESKKLLSIINEENWKAINKQVPGDYNYQAIYDYDIYKVRINLWNKQFEHFMDEVGATQTAHGESTSKSKNGSLSVGISGGAAGASAGVNAAGSGGFTNAESKYDMENLSERQKQQLINFYNKYPKPVYLYYNPKDYK